MRLLVFIFLLCSTIICHCHLNGQSAILVSSEGRFYEMEVINGTCTTKELSTFCTPSIGGYSLAQYKNKVYFSSMAGQLYEKDITNTSSCKPLNVEMGGNSMTSDKNGTLYWVTSGSLFRLPVGWSQSERLGSLPFNSAGDLVFFGDKLLMAAFGGVLVDINISSPPDSKIYMETPGFGFYGLINVPEGCNANKVYGISPNFIGGSDIVELDLINRKVVGKVCTINVNVYDAASITETGEVRGININNISVKPQCAGMGLGEIGIAATSATPFVQLSFASNNNPANSSGLFPGLTAGNYNIKVTSSDGCEKDTFATVKFIERLKVSTITIPDTCAGLTGAVTINPLSNHTGFRFSVENAAYVAGNVFTGLSSGQKSLKVIETNGCELDTSFTIQSFRPPLPITGVLVSGASCSLTNGSLSLNFVPGNQITGVRINDGNLQTTGFFSNLASGDHHLQIITATCVFDTTIRVPEIPVQSPVVSYAIKPSDCADKKNGTVHIQLTGSVPPYRYSFNNTPYSNNNFYQQLVSGIYTVSIEDAQGCIFMDTVTVPTRVVSPVTVQTTITPTDCLNKNTGRALISVFGNEAPYFFRINGRDFLAGQEASRLTAGIYMVQIRNGNNCLVDSIPVTITGQNIPGIVCDTVYVPTGFTPNGDGKNDELKPTAGFEVNNFIFRVYNRVGQVIFETRQPQVGWNGRYKAVDQPQGTYIWTFTYSGPGQRTKVFRGTVVLIR